MLIQRLRGVKRRGAAAVEMAIVCILLFLFLFGIFEYCRLLFVLHVANNAARDAARFASVHTSGGTMPGDPATISQADLINLVKTGQVQGINYGTGLCGMQGNIQGLNVTVFSVDPAGLAQNPAVIRPDPAGDWTTGSFSQNIGVQITGNYQPVLPSLLFMNASVPIQVTVMVSSEAN
jgi:Flp pilus assembly protein TadG